MTRRSVLAIACAGLLLAPRFAFSQASDVTGFEKLTLKNGLELFVLENHLVPLARVQITFRCGAIAQTADTAGLFHLYEHMLFKGNRAYRDQTEFQAAMKELGVASWNGGTSTEYVSYYFTVPSDKVEKGIEFWANAVRYPLLDPAELETEKAVVANEIRGYINDPEQIYESAVDNAMFWKYPWRKDVGGYEKAILSATVQSMQAIRDTYYVPNNVAVFVGGDVEQEAVRAAVEKYFGDWQSGKDPWAAQPPAHPSPEKDRYLVYPNEQMFQGVALVELRFRGPDVMSDPKATYAADVWGKILEDPNGRFKSSIYAKVPGLYKKEYMWASYLTQRDGGYISFSTYMLVSTQKSTFERMEDLKKTIFEEVSAMASDPSYFTWRDFEVLTVKLGDERILQRETVDGFIGELSFWWASASTDYYLGYAANLLKVEQPEIRRYLYDYIIDQPSVLSVEMSPRDFAREKAAAEKAGYATVTKDNAFWWVGR